MDVIESPHFGADIVIMQTVLEEVRHRSLPLYNRLNTLLAEPDRRFWNFSNEACACVEV
jgi:exosome complex exonuclease DIS3/RRP44